MIIRAIRVLLSFRVIRVMTPAQFQTIEEIFLAALQQEPDQVSAFLDTACEGDAVCGVKLKRS